MANAKPAKPDVVTYGDHEMITPDTSKLRKMLRAALPGEGDPVVQAEQALAAISSNFETWMDDECESSRRRPPKSQKNRPVEEDPAGAVSRRPRHQGRFRDAGIPGGWAGRRQPVPLARAQPRFAQDSVGDRRSARRRRARDHPRAQARRHHHDRNRPHQQTPLGDRRASGARKHASPRRAQGDPGPDAGARRVVLRNPSQAGLPISSTLLAYAARRIKRVFAQCLSLKSAFVALHWAMSLSAPAWTWAAPSRLAP